MTNPYVHYYTDQQNGHGMAVFKGSQWQRGYGQTGYGLGAIFRAIGRAAVPIIKTGARKVGQVALKLGLRPMIKQGAKALGDLALQTGVNTLEDVVCGKISKKQ